MNDYDNQKILFNDAWTLNKEKRWNEYKSPVSQIERRGFLFWDAFVIGLSIKRKVYIANEGVAMNLFNETESILNELQDKLNEINGLISEKKR